MAAFYDREKEQKELRVVLESEPSVVYFIYGPINSGKTALLIKVLRELQEDSVPFYINLRRRDVSTIGDFMNVLFMVDKRSTFENVREYIQEFGKTGADAFKNLTGIPIPLKIFDLLFKTKDKGEDAFTYLEEFFYSLVNEKGLKPILILDELQMIKQVANASGKPVLEKLFNFMVGMTKETHLCHCLAATSDSVFIEQIRGNAHLQGRSQQILVDDFNKEVALAVYDHYGFKDKELVWESLGGKPGDMIILRDWLTRGYGLKESLARMVQDEVSRLRMIEARLLENENIDPQTTMEFLYRFKNIEEIHFVAREMKKEVVFWVEQNVLFLEPHTEKLRPQGRVVKKAIERL